MKPNQKTVKLKLKEFREWGRDKFFDEYGIRRGAVSHYIADGAELRDAKAIWAASHNPPVATVSFNTKDAIEGFTALGFTCIDASDAQVFVEGHKSAGEAEFFYRRHPGLAKSAKKSRGTKCEVCDFDFAMKYGKIGEGFIECRHIVPFSSSNGKANRMTVADVRVLCSNCHRMVHTADPPLSVEELRSIISSLESS